VKGPRIGVLALQGAFALHCDALAACGAEPVEVREPHHLSGLAGLVLPGGESTTIAALMRGSGLWEPVRVLTRDGLAVFGTCAGMIIASSGIADPGPNDLDPIGAIDMTVRRNAFGRQIESFESDLEIEAIPGGPFNAVFIRAPVIETWESRVDVLAWQNERAVMARQGRVLVCAFHPELTSDRRIHGMFVDMASSEENA
jgi:5'-phosphate synthase pdxT subunit